MTFLFSTESFGKDTVHRRERPGDQEHVKPSQVGTQEKPKNRRQKTPTASQTEKVTVNVDANMDVDEEKKSSEKPAQATNEDGK